MTNWICVQGIVGGLGASPPPIDPGPYAKRPTRWRSRFEFIDFISSPVAIFAILSSPLHFAPVFAFCLLLTLVSPFLYLSAPPPPYAGPSFLPSTTPIDYTFGVSTCDPGASSSPSPSPASTPRELATTRSKQDLKTSFPKTLGPRSTSKPPPRPLLAYHRIQRLEIPSIDTMPCGIGGSKTVQRKLVLLWVSPLR